MRKTHNLKILNHLKKGKRITSLQAINNFGCTRLSARIYDLKQKGCPIQKQMIEVNTRNGLTRVAQYWIDPNYLKETA